MRRKLTGAMYEVEDNVQHSGKNEFRFWHYFISDTEEK